MTERYNRLVSALGDHLRLVAAAAVAFSLLGTFIWWAFGPRIEEMARELVGTTELKDLVIEQGVRLEQTQTAVAGLADRITAMEPAPAVAEYDVLRSDIQEMCVAGGTCRFTYRVRRTDDGESCGPPTAQRVLVDASGTTYFPQAGLRTSQPQRLSSEWSVISADFVVPHRVVEGVAEFSLQLTYPDCDRDILGRVVVVEESPHLIFEISGRTP